MTLWVRLEHRCTCTHTHTRLHACGHAHAHTCPATVPFLSLNLCHSHKGWALNSHSHTETHTHVQIRVTDASAAAFLYSGLLFPQTAGRGCTSVSQSSVRAPRSAVPLSRGPHGSPAIYSRGAVGASQASVSSPAGHWGAGCWAVALGRCDGAACPAPAPCREARKRKEVLSLGYHGNVVDLW